MAAGYDRANECAHLQDDKVRIPHGSSCPCAPTGKDGPGPAKDAGNHQPQYPELTYVLGFTSCHWKLRFWLKA